MSSAGPNRDDWEGQVKALTDRCPGVNPDDIIEIVEVVMKSISGDMSAVNMKLYAEIESLARFIHRAKSEICAMRPADIKDEHLAAATDELEAIVGSTEQATNAIFEAVETIEGLAPEMSVEMAETVTTAVTSIYEACGFQDITGQRITKVVKALQHIEGSLGGLLEAFGQEFENVTAAPKDASKPKAEGGRPDEHLMNGPQLPEDAISQADIDALLGFD